MKKILCILCVLVTILVSPIYASSIKVGFIPDGNFYILDENNNLSGYNYDYMLKIAQYTGIECEFVIIEEETLDKSYELATQMIINGEIDLIGSQVKTELTEEIFEFGQNYYAVVRTALCTLSNNTDITKNNFFTKDTINSALINGSTERNEYFFEIMDKYGIQPNVTYVDSREQAIELLISENVDVIIDTDFSTLHNSMSILEVSNPNPLYFVTRKGNSELLEKIDIGIEKIQVANSSIIENLQQKYFGSNHEGELITSQKEKNVLKQIDYFNVGIVKNISPYQFYDDDKQEQRGISKELLDSISKIIGIEFKYIWTDTYEEMMEKIDAGEIDIFATLPTDYQLAKTVGMYLTDPYIDNGVVWLSKHGSNMDFDKIYYHFISKNNTPYQGNELIASYDIEQTLREISENDNVALFCDPFIAQYYTQKLNITNVDIQGATNFSSDISMGVAKHIDPIIIGLLNHAILHLDSSEVDEIVYKNMIIKDGITLNDFLVKHSKTIWIVFMIIITIIFLNLYFQAKKFRNLSQTDGLTKLYNAGYFHKYSEQKMQKMQEGALILIDVDYFKQVNDTYGHQNGDKILKLVAKTVKRNFRVGDLVARLGGDEFVVFLEYEIEKYDFEERSTEILKQLSKKDVEIPVTLSIGACTFNSKTTYEDIYRLADSVLYEVKEKGRNGFACYSKDEIGIKNEK